MEKVIVIYLKALSQNMPGDTEGNHEKLKSG
jgi:hypothetical protein